MYEKIQPGLVGQASLVVGEEHVPAHLRASGTGVLSTPELVRLMEESAVNAVAGVLPPDHSTVGYEVCIKHQAPSPIGTRVTARATLREIDSRRLLFDVEAFDDKQKVGEGTHRRAIIDLKKFQEKAGK